MFLARHPPQHPPAAARTSSLQFQEKQQAHVQERQPQHCSPAPAPPSMPPQLPAAQTADPNFTNNNNNASWKQTQAKTFKRWINAKLAGSPPPVGGSGTCTTGSGKPIKHVKSLETDLSDGRLLIKLVETLSGKSLLLKNCHWHREPRAASAACLTRYQKLENVSLVLEFLEKIEQIRLINIDSSDIVDGNLKLILGLIWHLILHYSITKPLLVWDAADGQGCASGEKMTPKQRLLQWIQQALPELRIRDFTTDWNDGRALLGLLDYLIPGLVPDWRYAKSMDALLNAQRGLELALKWLNVPKLIKPEELINPEIDECSVMTYLAQFSNIMPKPQMAVDALDDEASGNGNSAVIKNCVKAFGPGLEKGYVGALNKFTIDTGAGTISSVSGSLGPLGLSIEGPSKARINCQDNHNGTWSAEYVVTEPGTYFVNIKFGCVSIEGSPFKVRISAVQDTQEPLSKPSQVLVCMPGGTDGLPPKPPPPPMIMCGKPPPPDKCPGIPLLNCEKGKGPISVSIIGLKNPPKIKTNADGTYNVTCYTTIEKNWVTNLKASVKWKNGAKSGSPKLKCSSPGRGTTGGVFSSDYGHNEGQLLRQARPAVGVDPNSETAALAPATRNSPIPKDWLRDEDEGASQNNFSVVKEKQNNPKFDQRLRDGHQRHHCTVNIAISMKIVP